MKGAKPEGEGGDALKEASNIVSCPWARHQQK